MEPKVGDDITIRFVVPSDGKRDELPDGSTILYGATILAPERWAGQVRDIILWGDGSVHLGADQVREAAHPVPYPQCVASGCELHPFVL